MATPSTYTLFLTLLFPMNSVVIANLYRTFALYRHGKLLLSYNSEFLQVELPQTVRFTVRITIESMNIERPTPVMTESNYSLEMSVL